jgi:hypothetical protein
MNILKFKNQVDKALFVINQTSGYVAAIGFFAVVQAVGIAMFFSSIFYKKVELMLQGFMLIGAAMPIEVVVCIGILAAILGTLAGIVIETGSFFFAINGHPWESLGSAIASGVLSVASYNQLLLDKTTNWIMVGGVFVLGAYPALFIILASHRLANKIKDERVIETVKAELSQLKTPEPKTAKTIQFERKTTDLDNLLKKVI